MHLWLACELHQLYKLYYYAHLNFDSDTTNNEYQKMNGKIENLLAEYNKKHPLPDA